MHLNSELLFKKYAKQYFKDRMRILEIGPGAVPSAYNQIVDNSTLSWETLDIYDDKRFSYVSENEYQFPIPDNTFDIIISGQVIEHVKKPWVWMKELSRVCKKNGLVITIAPVSWIFHGAPVDCWRIYPEGMKTLYEEAGLLVDLCKMESLEYQGDRRVIPGVTSCELSDKNFSVKSLIKKIVRWPLT